MRHRALAWFLAAFFGAGIARPETAPEPDRRPEVNFRYPVGGALARSPIVQGDTVYLLSEDRAVYALTDDGKILYRWQAEGKQGLLHPALYGLVFFLPGDGNAIALNRVGREAFRIPVAPDLALPPVLAENGRIYAAWDDLTCFGLSGYRKWKTQLPSRAVAGPVVTATGRIATLCLDGTVIVADPYGAVKATSDAGAGAVTIAASGSLLAVGSGSTALLFSSSDGSKVKAVSLGAAVRIIRPAPREVDFVVLTQDSTVHGVSAERGLVWSVPVRGEKPEDIVSRTDRLYALSPGLVTSMDYSGGVWRELSIRNPGTMPAVSDRGVVYSGGLDWILYSFKFEDRPIGGSEPQAFRANPPLPALLGVDFRLESGDGQKELLSEVEKILKSGTIGEGEEEAFALSAYVLRTVKDAYRVPGKPLSQYDPTVRIKAAEIMAMLGGMEPRDVLVDSFAADPDPAVKAACADALGLIGYDGDGRVAAAFDDEMTNVARRPDERLADSIAGAIERIYRFEGSPANPRAIRALFKVADGPYPEPVRRRALAVMMRISRGTY